MAASNLTAQRLRELFDYDDSTGHLIRRVTTSCRSLAGSVAGHQDKTGYRRVVVDGSQYLAHRLIWLYVTGDWPTDCIDHINGTPEDNRFTNLRDVSHSINNQNAHRKKSSAKHTQLLGAYKVGKRWSARIVVDGSQRHLGYFGTPEEASAAYLAKKRELHAGCTI